MIIWLTGKSGTGKTTIAKDLIRDGWINLDGDDMRESINSDCDLSKEGREENNLRIAKLAKVLSRQHNIVVSVICPTTEIRSKVHGICKPVWVYIIKDIHPIFEQIYEEPQWFDLSLNHNELTRNESIAKLKDFINDKA